MDDLITLRTSDDPPLELKSARSVLAVNSKVFADMLLILPRSSTTSQRCIVDLAETESELTPFLRLLNLSHEEGDPLEELKVDDWPVVARLADKYDSATVRALVLVKCMSWAATAGSLGLLEEYRSGFRTAVELKQSRLATTFLWRVVQLSGSSGLSSVRKHQAAALDKWTELLRAHAAYCAMTASIARLCPTCNGDDGTRVELIWHQEMRSTVQNWDWRSAFMPFYTSIYHALSTECLCETCDYALLKQLAFLDQSYRDTAPDFPL